MIDAHQHVWALGRNGCTWPTEAEGQIFRDFALADFRAEAVPHGVTRTILVQSQENARDTEWLIEVAETAADVAAVVGWTDLAAPDAPEHIAALAARPKLKGLRPMVEDRAADWYDDPALEPGLKAIFEYGLRLDVLVRVPHLAALDRLARRMPELPIVIDHAAKPRIGADGGFEEWHSAIAPLAKRRNVFCKLSGLLTECIGAPAEAAEPYARSILHLFGPERAMWGSDWPVLELASTYDEWLSLARALVPTAAHEEVFGRTAARFYGVEQAP
jgi:L-fuconolactonase